MSRPNIPKQIPVQSIQGTDDEERKTELTVKEPIIRHGNSVWQGTSKSSMSISMSMMKS